MKKSWMLLCCMLSVAYAATYPLPKHGDIVGDAITLRAQPGDTVWAIAHDHDLSVAEVLAVNPHLSPERLQVGDVIDLPTQRLLPPHPYREGIVINMPEKRLYYFDPVMRTVSIYPVAMGRSQWRTPLMKTRVVRQKKGPHWYVPRSIHRYVLEKKGYALPRVVPPGPENPLGSHAIYLARPGILIHGTNQPQSIGKLVSSGCIRMHNHDVAELFKRVQPGTLVTVMHMAQKAGWHEGDVYVETYQPVSLEDDKHVLYRDDVSAWLKQAADKHDEIIHWDAYQRAVKERRGLPVPVSSS